MTDIATGSDGSRLSDGAGYAQPAQPDLDANTLLEIMARQRNDAANRAATFEAIAIRLGEQLAELNGGAAP